MMSKVTPDELKDVIGNVIAYTLHFEKSTVNYAIN